jgi:pimeloyl-ACP methyl ester carboxylesterase
MLDGVAPPWMAIPESFAADGQRALDAMLARCEASACGRAFPDLKSDLDTLLTSLAEEPQQIELMHPRSGEPLSFELTRGGFARELRLLLYAPEIVALLPYTLARAKKGDYAPFVAETVLVEETAAENMSFGLLLTVVCSEDVPRIVAPLDGGGFLGTVTVEAFRKACAAWPSAAVPESFYERAPLDVPALLLSGELDPVTPPRWADDVLRDLPRGRHLVVPGMGHGVSVRSCVPRLLRTFLQAPEDVATLDASCLADEAPPFFIHAAGPPP